ncbi:MAG: acyl-CoA dehydrogenase family protein [Acidimicrobiia bacterium]|nr:acyl-CoA dehydrogenase family protein [Acidimicrobiia bacterium]
MTQPQPRDHLGTHIVENQPSPRRHVDLWAGDPVLQAVVTSAEGDTDVAARAGATLGSDELREAGREARRVKPELVAFDRAGRRLDEVRYHPAYHRLLSTAFELGYTALPWEGASGGSVTAGGHVTHAAILYCLTQTEPGVCCPLTMTYAGVPALSANADLEAIWRPRLTSRHYDPSAAPIADKESATLGMAMTEKQGGSDVRTNTTTAQRDGDVYRLNGHKWFCSAPMSDGFLTLAQTRGGLTCFLVPRWLDDERNGINVMRLKDKLGNQANASAEIEYVDALGWRLGDEGRGVATIIEMVHHTRLDCAVAPAALMRASIDEAFWWAQHRQAFKRLLVDQPLMQAVLADLVLDWEGAVGLAFRAAHACDQDGLEERALARLVVALAKFLNNKRCVRVTYEAMECLGGMGYVEDTPMPMLYREAPLNSIWEGSGNVICLDVLRTLVKEPLAGEMLGDELRSVAGVDRRYDEALAAHESRWPGLPTEQEARWFTESLANLLTASILLRFAPAPVADGYVATRLTGERGHVAGSVAGLDTSALLARING